ncbi:MAG: DUF3141 domain-containing protein [Ancalomicrobiaceae bacterium]|nr:DUF3141 domain-containing protein [Ancalomicrobiaceae bacterium]
MGPTFSVNNWPALAALAGRYASEQAGFLATSMSAQWPRIAASHLARTEARFKDWQRWQQRVAQLSGGPSWFDLVSAYSRDAAERTILTLDTLRERGNNDVAHEAAGTPPVLIYDYEVVSDGADMREPVNYFLLHIKPPAGVRVNDWKRPYVIIDPRAGHGAGIGGFKPDSQVGVALKDGHPVYFVAFHPHPMPGQTLAHVARAEAQFIREVSRRHPRAPKPIIVGNCQGGWAAMLVAATNPDITGPLVINGAPLAYWSGRIGENPMRYNGGLLGGVVPSLVISDLGNGEFDGAHLVSNFELLNPSRTLFGKYVDLFADPEGGRERFLEFERWWGGFHFMNEAEIRWVVEELFVGNKLARGEALLEHGKRVDLKLIRSPIIVFASFGDNITPPQQALNWILDTYSSEDEIKLRGQRILYMVHDKVGHLGIFVSSSIAKREHTEVASTLKTIEALAPGLYEMKIDDEVGQGVDTHFVVSFHERKLDDIRALDSGREEESAFAAVSRLSEIAAEIYDLSLRPVVQAAVTEESAAAFRALNPARVQRAVFSDRNPAAVPLAHLAERVKADRHSIDPGDPLRDAEKLWFAGIEQAIDFARDMRDAAWELMFFSLYASPMMRFVGRVNDYQRRRRGVDELRLLPSVQAQLRNIERGGFAEGVIRMLIVLANARGNVRRSRLERSANVLTHREPFKSLGAERRADLINEQTVIVEFELDQAIEALPKLLKGADERTRAIAVVDYIVGAVEEMEPHTLAAIQRFRSVLELPPLAVPEQQLSDRSEPEAGAAA